MERILVVTWLELRHGREIFRGVFDYTRERGLPWRLVSIPLEKAGGRLPREPMADAAICATVSEEIRDWTARRAADVVNVATHDLGRHWPTVCQDDHAVGQMAAEHLMGLGFRRFACTGIAGNAETRGRLTGFIETVLDAGHPALVRRTAEAALPEPLRGRVGRYLDPTDLPTPVGVFTASCHIAQHLIADCDAAGLSVPHDIAVIAADEDEFLAHTAYPPLSTVEVNSRRIGHRAAEVLETILRGDPPPPGPELVRPVRVIPRQSTNVVAVDDPVLSAAMRFIHDHRHRSISVADVLDHVHVNRRKLERRFRDAFGRSPHQAIRDVRIKAVRDLLATTTLPIEEIAHRTGFCSPAHLSHLFRKHTGQTPSGFRERSG